MLPPSQHQSGQGYRWLKGRSPFEVPLPALPDAVLQALKEREERQQKRNTFRADARATAMANDDVRVNYIPGISKATQQFLRGKFAFTEGWNTRLFNAACDMAGNRVDEHVATELLLAGAKPIDDRELEKARATIRSAFSEKRIPARAYHSKSKSTRGTRSIQRVGRRTIIRIEQ